MRIKATLVSAQNAKDLYDQKPTLAKLVKTNRPDWSWNECKRAILSGRIYADGAASIDPTSRFSPDTAIEIRTNGSFTPRPKLNLKNNLKVFFHDNHLIVIEKASGLESVPYETRTQTDVSRSKKKNPTAIDLARVFLETVERRKLPPLRVVHRLDKGTSGIMIFARTKVAEQRLGQIFRDHTIQRTYDAICLGIPENKTIQSQILVNRGDGLRGSVNESGPCRHLGKKAITHIKNLETKQNGHEKLSRVECRLETGRTHQIRIHLTEQGHPLAGDKIYRSRKAGLSPIIDNSKAPRIALHARELGFLHPVTNQKMYWTSPLPEDLQLWWSSLKSM